MKTGKIRGIITTAFYEARAFGVKTAMSVNEALSLCPHLKMLAQNYPLYHRIIIKTKRDFNKRNTFSRTVFNR